MSIVDRVHELFDKLEADLSGLLHSHVAEDAVATAETDGKALLATGREQVANLVAEVEADAKADVATAEGDVKDIAGQAATDENPPNGVPTGTPPGQPAAAQTVDNPQHQPTEPANPAEPAAPASSPTPADGQATDGVEGAAEPASGQDAQSQS